MSYDDFVAEGAVTVFGTLENSDKGGECKGQINSANKEQVVNGSYRPPEPGIKIMIKENVLSESVIHRYPNRVDRFPWHC